MQLPWFIAALGAAIVWGMHYPLIDFAMKRISVYSVLLLSTLPVFFAMPLFIRTLSRDVDVFRSLPLSEQLPIAAVSLTSTFGAVFLYLAVSSKNATLASLIEISYPVFVVIFAYLFFKQLHVNLSVIAGGLMILVGASLIIANNQ
jgi:drug/metabolite transporter (DMT)-like permease